MEVEVLSQNRDRFKDAPWIPKNEEYVLIGGAGGIGSWLSFFLSRIGFKIYLWDFDVIEAHNIGGQLFKTADVGSLKVAAVDRIVREYAGAQISTFNEPFTEASPAHAFMFSAFDNMKARKDMFNVWKRGLSSYGNNVKPIFIDGRLELEQLQIFCVTPQYMDEYERDHLFDDSVVEDAACTLKQTSHTAGMIATHMTAFFTSHIENMYEGDTLRTVPFYYEYVVAPSLTTEHS